MRRILAICLLPLGSVSRRSQGARPVGVPPRPPSPENSLLAFCHISGPFRRPAPAFVGVQLCPARSDIHILHFLLSSLPDRRPAQIRPDQGPGGSGRIAEGVTGAGSPQRPSMMRWLSSSESVKNYTSISCQTYTPPFLHHQTDVPGRLLIGVPLFAVTFNLPLMAGHRLLRLGKGCLGLRAWIRLISVQKGSETVRNLTGD